MAATSCHCYLAAFLASYRELSDCDNESAALSIRLVHWLVHAATVTCTHTSRRHNRTHAHNSCCCFRTESSDCQGCNLSQQHPGPPRLSALQLAAAAVLCTSAKQDCCCCQTVTETGRTVTGSEKESEKESERGCAAVAPPSSEAGSRERRSMPLRLPCWLRSLAGCWLQFTTTGRHCCAKFRD